MVDGHLLPGGGGEAFGGGGAVVGGAVVGAAVVGAGLVGGGLDGPLPHCGCGHGPQYGVGVY
ncbi:hypothetical protein, partial [Micromonospora sp. C41]|uniref:hypothetical protein n=1 Tax=Micromonospora sp. C41 TaxID=2824878 RepID=UPI001B35BCB0